MGCSSGKVSGPQASGNAASAECTLLAAQPTTPEKEPSTADTANKSRGAVSMVVIDCAKMWSTYEGLARALDVYHDGWVAGFNDVETGDTGTLLGEVSTPSEAVAIRLHRNGGVVCMARKAVEKAGLNGVWDCGEIHGDQLTWSDGTISQMRIDEVNRRFSVTFEGESYTADFNEDDKIRWSDGDTWSRRLGPKAKAAPAATPASESVDAAGHVEAEAAPDTPAAAEHSRLSTVPEEPSRSASSATSPNPAVTAIEAATAAIPTPAATTTEAAKEVETDRLSSERPLFAGVASQMPDAKSRSEISEKQPRRERTMCCC